MPEPTAGSAADLSHRVERLERDVASLSGTVSRVEQNQLHAEELNKLRFSSLDTSLTNHVADLKAFMTRIEGMISGEVETAQARQGRELVADYQKWRAEVDDDRETYAVQAGRLDLLGKLAVILVGGQVLTILAAIYAVAQHPPAGIGS